MDLQWDMMKGRHFNYQKNTTLFLKSMHGDHCLNMYVHSHTLISVNVMFHFSPSSEDEREITPVF